MKTIKYWLFAAAGVILSASCADYLETNDYVVSRPGNAELYDYLNDYQPLKEYLDRSAHPGFKVGAALTASEFNKKEMLYALASANFDEIVAGNAMKMASCVDDKGNMNFSTVSAFVNAAADAGLTVYGHTLAWHSQQPVKWLNTLIADIELPTPEGEGNQCLKMTTSGPSENVWDYQLNYTLPEPLVTGKTYNVSITAKATNGLESVPFWPCDAQGAVLYTGFSGLAADGDMTTLSLTFTAEADYKYLQFSLGKLDGDFFLDDFVVTEAGSDQNLVVNGNFDEEVKLKDVGWQEDGNVPGNTWWKYSWVNFMVGMESLGGASFTIEWVNQLTNSEMAEGASMDNFVVREPGKGDVPGAPIPGEGPDGKNCIKITSIDNPANSWDTQFFIYTPNKTWAAGEPYKISFWYRASQEAGCETQCHGTPGAYKHWQMLPSNPTFTPEWQYYEAEGTIPGEGDGMQAIAFNLNVSAVSTDYYFADIRWSIQEKSFAPTTYWVNAIKNSDMTGDDFSCFIVRNGGGGGDTQGPGYPGEGPDGGVCVKVQSIDNPANSWDTQFFIYTPDKEWAAGEKYRISFDYKADKPAGCETQCHNTPGGYMHWAMLPSNPNFTTEWQHYEAEAAIPGEGAGMHAIAFNLNVLTEANTYYFANIKWEYEMSSSGGTRPQTDEEKHDTLTYAMNLWINNMMQATAGQVKAWDLVNEAISGGGNIDGYYDLQHATGSSTNDFFWQDYLGNVDYVVTAEKAARSAYAAIEGTNPADLKLFINDYNLESTWDNNHKLESLIYWIGKWEEAGAKIDGIGTQMHISYFLDPDSQARQQAAITRMFELMAKTGKLVRVSELDMGISDKQFGTSIPTEQVTFDQLKAMGEYYKWIIQEYFRIVPVAQQYGITQWCLTDAPASSGWRGGEPVGLWFEDYTRKPAYAGWAEGLQSK